jgi:hypothetical protein
MTDIFRSTMYTPTNRIGLATWASLRSPPEFIMILPQN